VIVQVNDIAEPAHSFGFRQILHAAFLPLQMSLQVLHAFLA
jgi:hypothetical protein